MFRFRIWCRVASTLSGSNMREIRMILKVIQDKSVVIRHYTHSGCWSLTYALQRLTISIIAVWLWCTSLEIRKIYLYFFLLLCIFIKYSALFMLVSPNLWVTNSSKTKLGQYKHIYQTRINLQTTWSLT